MTELDRMIEAVDAGNADVPRTKGSHGLWLFFHAFPPHEGKNHTYALDAYHGSLDAAKALHDALIPGWDLLITTYEDDAFEVSVSPPLSVKTHDGLSDVISRAWLLATLRAYRAQQEQQP